MSVKLFWRYLAATFLVTFFFQFLLVILLATTALRAGGGLYWTLLVLGGSAPTVVAVYLVLRHDRQTEKRNFFKSIVAFRKNPGWFVFALFFPLAIGGLYRLMEDDAQGLFDLSASDLLMFIPALFLGILLGGLEEVGWRGLLFRELQYQGPLVVVALLTGGIWGLWHIPLFFIEGTAHGDYAFLPYFLGALMYGVFLTYILVRTRSIGMAILSHAAINAAASIGLSIVFRHDLFTYLYLALFILIGCFLLLQYEKEASH